MSHQADEALLNLDCYILQEQIGSGSFGKVFKVKNKITKDIYAAKISIDSINDATNELFMSISSEIGIISQLNHPSVLKFITCSPVNFKGKPKPVIITEYASNGSLSDLLDHDKKDPNNIILNDTRKLIIIYGIASAMSYLHSHNIIHRDLKPGNVLIDSFLFPKVSDFGLSKSGTPNEGTSLIKTAKGNVKGTPIYMSPEIWQKSEYSPLSDVYAFSIVMFEIMMNEKPYQNDDFFNLINLIQQKQRPKFNKEIPAAYKDLIERCWSQDPRDRPSFDEIMKELKTNHGFITEKVNEGEFLNYIRYVDEYKTTFNLNKSASIRSSFNKLREIDHKNFDANKSTIKIEDLFGIKTHFPYKYFLQLNKENQKLIMDAEAGDSEKQLIVAQNLIQFKHDFPFNTKIGIDFLRMSINNGNKKSLIYYIKMIIKGNIIPKNLKKAKKLLETGFSDDKSTYLYLYGKLFKKEKQYKKAENYFQQSLSNCNSLYEYAEMYRKGYLQIKSWIDISKYYKQSIELGNINSLFKYGLYLTSFEDKEKQEEGDRLIKDSLSKGCIKALYYYGTKLEKEIDENQKENQSKEIEMINNFRLSAYEGYDKSINKYGIKLYHFNYKSMKGENFDESIKYLKIGCDKGFIDSMYELGKYYADADMLIPINAKEGERYIRISAESGYADAIGYYGTLLILGMGVEVDVDRAIQYYKTAISKGSSVAMNDYAYLLNEGKFVKTNYKEARKYYKMAIEKGNVDAMVNYAMMFDEGEGVKVNYQKAIKYYKMAIDKGDCVAMNNYAKMVEDGRGTEVDFQEAIKYYKMAMDKGERMAMNNYAKMLEDKSSCEVDYQEAIKYYKMAIDKGEPISMYHYANMIEHGKGVEVNYQEAIKYYKMAIDKGSPSAMYYYANMLEHGKGIEVNYQEAAKYYKMAIDEDSNLDQAMNSYADMLWEGKGVDIDKEEAIKYYKMAIRKGNEDSMFSYGKKLCEDESIADIKKGIKYIKKAANLQNKDAQSYLGLKYLKGEFVRFNKAKGIEYYEKSARNGNIKSLLNLGYVYHKGYDGFFEKNNEKSIEFYTIAAKENNKTAKFNLGVIYLKGDADVPIDKFKAALYFQSAAEQNDLKSQLNLGVLFTEGVPSLDYEKAFDLFKKSSKQNNPKAQYNLGVLYSIGKGVDKSMEKAVKYFQKSADQNIPEALFKLGHIYLNGSCEIEEDKRKAINFFEKGLKYNSFDKKILIILGNMYQKGDGVDKDENKSNEFLTKASHINDSEFNDQFLKEEEIILEEIELIQLKEMQSNDITQNEKEEEEEMEEEEDNEDEEEEEEEYEENIEENDKVNAQNIDAKNENVEEECEENAEENEKVNVQNIDAINENIEEEECEENTEENEKVNVQESESSSNLPPLKQQNNQINKSDITKSKSISPRIMPNYQFTNLYQNHSNKEPSNNQNHSIKEPSNDQNYSIKEPSNNQNQSQQRNEFFSSSIKKAASPRSIRNKIKILIQKSNEGDIISQLQLGACYSRGEGVSRDEAKAFTYFMKAAEAGDKSAQFIVGTCFSYGKGTEINKEEAFKFYVKSAEQGYSKAQFAVGHIYKYEKNESEDDEQIAIEWYRKAALQGHKAAMKALQSYQ